MTLSHGEFTTLRWAWVGTNFNQTFLAASSLLRLCVMPPSQQVVFQLLLARCGTTEHFLSTNTYVRGLHLTTYSYLVCVSQPSIIMLSFIPMKTHTHSLSTTIINENTIAQYKGRGNSLNNESARNICINKYSMLQVFTSILGSTKFHT